MSKGPAYASAMTWITTVGRENAEPRLRETYDRIAGKNGTIDNILLAHSLRPHTLTGHLALYKAVLHHSRNRLPVSFLETIGVLVSHLNGCAYCVDHHSAGLRELLGDDARHAVRNWRTSPPIGMTWETPGMASSRGRSTKSA